METREIIAYALIVILLTGCTSWCGFAWYKHQRAKLRLRGVKRYEH